MADAIDSQAQDTQSAEENDPWAAAFAAINSAEQTTDVQAEQDSSSEKDNAGGEKSHTANSEYSDDSTAEGNDGQSANADSPATGDGSVDEGLDGGLDSGAREDSTQDDSANGDTLGISDDELTGYREGFADEIRNRAIADVAKAFIDKGVMHQGGKLGATVTDPAIMERDEDGVPHFYNPETKREFTGENPRKQAQEWCDEYNAELATAFNEACEKYSASLMERENPSLQVLEFASTYDKLDPITKMMFDNVIEDYEITDDDGKITGYSCDLNKAYAMVQRQVQSIQSYGRSQADAASKQPTGPALDMKNSAGAVKNDPTSAPKSLAEAMERLQNQQLEDLKKGK